MKIDLRTGVYNLPGARQYVHLAGKDLAAGTSLLLLLPSYLDQSWFHQQLLDYLEDKHFILAISLDLSENPDAEPIKILTKALPDSERQIKRLEQLVIADGLPDVIILEKLEKCSTERISEWLFTMTRWAEACNSSGSSHSLAMLTSARSACGWQLPNIDVRLKYHLWAGVPSVLETRILCREQMDSINADSQWREHILSSLAGNDPILAEALWNVVLGTPEEIFASLTKFANKQSWNKVAIEQRLGRWKPKPPGDRYHITPADPGFSLLGEGYTLCTPEYGEEIHPAILALLDRRVEVYHRIWRAQAALLLPWIDDIRRRIYQALASTIEPEWLDNPPLELGKFKTHLDNLPDSSKEKQQWASTIYWAWYIRNELAHYTPISYDTYLKFWSLCIKGHAMISPLL